MTSTRPLPRSLSLGLPVLAVGLVIAGVVVHVATAATVPSGWFAYAPLSHSALVPHVAATWWIAPVLIGLGVAVAAFWAGLLVGRRG